MVDTVTVFPPTPRASSRPPSIRSRRVSADSIQLAPLDTVTMRYHHSVSSEEADTLPALLSPSGSSASERDRPSTPATFVSEHGSYASSQVSTESSLSTSDDRSRYIRPGTPIQTQLPDIELLSIDDVLSSLDATSDISSLSHPSSGAGSYGNGFWVVSDDGNIHQTQYDIPFSQDDEDVVGDMGRAKELLEGLEKIVHGLVRRYEKIRGDGHDICAICRDLLIAPAQPVELPAHNSDGRDQPDITWNLFASSVLPFNNYNLSEEEDDNCGSIHAFPCAHLFHTACLFPWLCIKTTCPTCRLDIDPHSLTLRVRGWSASRFPQFDGGDEPRYVNVDVLGRRIPWQRPPALTLEQWVSKRESESPAETTRGNQGEQACLFGDKQADTGGLPKLESRGNDSSQQPQVQGDTTFENCSPPPEASAAIPTDALPRPDSPSISLSISTIAATGVEGEIDLGVRRIERDTPPPRGFMPVRNGRMPRDTHVALADHAPEEDMPFTRLSLEYSDGEHFWSPSSENISF
jgi:hypothetical protein